MVVSPIHSTVNADFAPAQRIHPSGSAGTQSSEAVADAARKAAQKAQAERQNEAGEKIRKSEVDTRTINLGETSITFEVNEELDRVVTKVVNKQTGKVIREIPAKELQEVAAQLRKVAGRLLHKIV